LLRATQVIHTGAGRIGNGELIDEKMLPVKRGVKGQIMQEIMGHYDQVPRFQLVPNRGQQLLVQLAKMRLCGCVKRLGSDACAAGCGMGFRELKLKQLEKIAYARHGCSGDGSQVASTQHTDVDNVPRPIVCEKRRMRGEGGRSSLQSYRPRTLQRRELS